MKKVFLLTGLLSAGILMHGQILKRVADKIKGKNENKENSRVDSTINKTGSSADTIKNQEGSISENKNNENGSSGFKTYSKYDFVPGEKVIGFEDFSTGNIGDFPAGWNTNGSGEIVTVEGKAGRWLWITKPGLFMPEFTDKYPEDFTFEFDLLHGIPFSGALFSVVIAEMNDITMLLGWNTSPHTFKTEFYVNSARNEGNISTEIRKNSTSQSANEISTELMSDKYNPIHIAIWRQKERVRVYCNQEKVWDIPKAIAPDAKLNAIFFPIQEADATIQYYVGNIRLAVGAPDTRNKILTQNKWVTHGILFDVNSAIIKPESYGTLKEMANVLKEYPDLKVKIIGHTDADGNDVSNLDLSKRRAASVKAALAKEFGIVENRMETDGKGEGEPMDKNDNPAGKANNRRVEFIKI